MGLLSGIGKAVKGIFKGIGKVFKAIGKGVKKLFSSSFGKVLLIAAAVFFGGAALGLWASPFATAAGTAAAGTATTTAASSVTGAAAAGGLAETAGLAAHMGTTGAGIASGVATGASMGAPVAAGTLTETAISGATQTAAGLGGATGSASGLVGSTLAPVSAATGPVIQGAGAASGGLWGTVTGAASSASAWMNAHPMLTMMGGNMLSSMFTPSEAEEKIEFEEWKQKNTVIGGIDYKGRGTPTDYSGMDRIANNYPQNPMADPSSPLNPTNQGSFSADYYNQLDENRKKRASGLLAPNMAGG